MKPKEKKIEHWKSLPERDRDPKFLEANRDEFPELVANRRDFLKLMGFSVTAATLAACSRAPVYKAMTYLNKPEETLPGVSNWYATTCAGCSAACGLLVKVRDGRPIKVEGNPESPLNRGGTCAVGQAMVLSLYDGARLQGPAWKGVKTSWSNLDSKVQQALRQTATNGKKVVVLSSTVTSPTTRHLIGEFVSFFGQGEHITYDPISSAAILKGNELSFNEKVIPAYRFQKADVIVGINADFLGSWLSPVEFTRQYVVNRRLDKGAKMSRHIQFESFMSLTGSNADQRIPIQPEEEGIIAWELLKEVARLAGSSVPEPPALQQHNEEPIKKVAQELWRRRGRSLVVSGSNNVDVQLLVNALNKRLGNIGRTIDFDNPSFQKQGNDEAIRRLIDEMKRGEVGALLIYGANPLYDLSESKAFQAGLKKVDFSLSFALYKDETATKTDAIAPDLHSLESWNDAEPQAGLFHLMQPTIAPLFDTRSVQDSLLRWLGRDTDYYHYLQGWWQTHLFSRQTKQLGFESFWNQSLHDGFWQARQRTAQGRSMKAGLQSTFRSIRQKSQRKEGSYSLCLYEPCGVRNGQQANNPWLQELPDPVTKVTWDNYALLAPAEARSLDLKEGDVVSLRAGKRSVKLPVYLQPGQPPKTIAVALGYGRTAAGRVGDGVGQNLYPFVTSTNGTVRYGVGNIQLAATGQHVSFASTQTHHSMEGRPIIKEATLPAYQHNPAAGNEEAGHFQSLWPEHKYAGPRWGLAIDLNACTGCSSCIIGCQSENNVPVVGKDEVRRRREMHWIRIDRYYSGDEANPEVAHQPMMCQHCGNAPCETVCPVLATVHSSDGLNQQVYNRCVGTRYCANNCPYKVRRFNWFDYFDNDKFDFNMNSELGKMVLNPDLVVRSRGVMEKCSMCVQRIQEGKLTAKLSGKKLSDGTIQTGCQQACPADAIVFGNLNDPKSRIAHLVKDKRYYHVLAELNVRPVVGYLTKIRNKENG